MRGDALSYAHLPLQHPSQDLASGRVNVYCLSSCECRRQRHRGKLICVTWSTDDFSLRITSIFLLVPSSALIRALVCPFWFGLKIHADSTYFKRCFLVQVLSYVEHETHVSAWHLALLQETAPLLLYYIVPTSVLMSVHDSPFYPHSFAQELKPHQ